MPLEETAIEAVSLNLDRALEYGSDAKLFILRRAAYDGSGYEVVAEVPDDWYLEQSSGQFDKIIICEGEAASREHLEGAMFFGFDVDGDGTGDVYEAVRRKKPQAPGNRVWPFPVFLNGETFESSESSPGASESLETEDGDYLEWEEA